MFSLSQILVRMQSIGRDTLAVRFGEHKLSWQQLHDEVEQLAGALVAAGLGKGDRVAVLAPNSVLTLQLMFAVPWAGGVFVPINTRLSVREMLEWVADSSAQVVVVADASDEVIAALREGCGDGVVLIHHGDKSAPDGFRSLTSLLAKADALPDQGRCGEDVAALFYTGGTTGRSKGVMLSHAGIILNSLQWCSAVGVTPSDRILVVAPMFHMVGALNAVVGVMLGVEIVILPRFDPKLLLRSIEETKPTKVALVPVMIDAMVRLAANGGYDLSSLRKISYGGSPISERSLENALRVLPDVDFYQIYGQTEGGPTISVLGPQYHVLEGPMSGRLRSAGRPVPLTEVRIVDPAGQPAAPGEVGEICVCGPALSLGYWNQPEATEAVRVGQWRRTGDAGYIDDEGFLYIVDRIKDMIVSGGENVYAAEVENVLYQHPAVSQCAVIGIPSDRWGEQVHAVVHPLPDHDVDADELIAFCRERLAAFKSIRSVDFSRDPLPLSGANKILKRVIRDRYWKDNTAAP